MNTTPMYETTKSTRNTFCFPQWRIASCLYLR